MLSNIQKELHEEVNNLDQLVKTVVQSYGLLKITDEDLKVMKILEENLKSINGMCRQIQDFSYRFKEATDIARELSAIGISSNDLVHIVTLSKKLTQALYDAGFEKS